MLESGSAVLRAVAGIVPDCGCALDAVDKGVGAAERLLEDQPGVGDVSDAASSFMDAGDQI
jgi:hypothetical protein